MSENTGFIEVLRVLSGDEASKENTHTSPEGVEINLIGGFRPWKKGKNDMNIKGEMTLIVYKPNPKDDASKNPKSILIEESYREFRDRLGSMANVSVKK